MSTLFKVCGGALIAAICTIILKTSSKTAAAGVGTIGTILVLGLILGRISEIITPLKSTLEDNGMGSCGDLMLKSLGIGLIVRTVSDICRDLGEESLAGGVELIGKVEILILCLPFITEMTELLRGLLE